MPKWKFVIRNKPKHYGLRNQNSMGCATKTVWAAQPNQYGLRNQKSIKFDFTAAKLMQLEKQPNVTSTRQSGNCNQKY